ncbi:hypothetical protein ACSQ67_017436 [Phaseolus vulgaris]
MTMSNGNNGVRVERRALEAPKNLMEVIFILAEAIMLLCYTERRHMFNLPRAIAHAVLDKGKKTIGSECCERSDCVEVKGPQILKELYELKRMLTCAMLFSSKRSVAFLFAAGFEEEDILYRKRTSRVRSDNDDSDDDNEDEDQLLNPVGNLKQENHANIYASVCPVTTSTRRRLYPPGRIMHMIPSHMSENSNSNHSDADEKHVCLLYQTPTELYGKLRFSRGMVLDHPTTKYLKKLQQLINKLEKE